MRDRKRTMSNKEIYEEFKRQSLEGYKRIEEQEKQERIKRIKDALSFKNKTIGVLFYVFISLALAFYILFFFPSRFLMDEHCQELLGKVFYYRPKSYSSSYYIGIPFFLSLFFTIVCSVLKDIDNDLKSACGESNQNLGSNFFIGGIDKAEMCMMIKLKMNWSNFKNKKIGRLYRGLLACAGFFLIWFFLHPYLLDEYSSFYIGLIIEHSPTGFISFLSALPILMFILLVFVCIILKILDNDLESVDKKKNLEVLSRNQPDIHL